MRISLWRDATLLFSYCALIFFLSHQSTLPVPMAFPHQDKLTHLIAYAFMALLAWRTFSHGLTVYRMVTVATVIFCSFYGITDEYHQSFIEGRDSDLFDWLADTAGAVLAVVAMNYYCRRSSVLSD